MAFDNVVDTITMEEIVPMCVDTVLRSNTFTTVALARPKVFRAATQDFPKGFECLLTDGEVKYSLIYGETPNLRVDNAYQVL